MPKVKIMIKIAKRAATIAAACAVWLAIAEQVASQPQSVNPITPYFDPSVPPPAIAPKAPVLGTTAPPGPRIDSLIMASAGGLAMIVFGTGLWLVDRVGRRTKNDMASQA